MAKKVANTRPIKNKSILKSKTVWANVLTIALIPLLPESVRPIISQPEVLATILACINVIMRIISKDKVYLF